MYNNFYTNLNYLRYFYTIMNQIKDKNHLQNNPYSSPIAASLPLYLALVPLHTQAN